MSETKVKFQELRVGEIITAACGTFRVKEFIARGRCCMTYEGENVSPKAGQQEAVALKLFSGHQDYTGALLRENMVLHTLAGEKHIVGHYGQLTLAGKEEVLVQELLTGTVADIAAGLQADERSPSAWLLYTLATHAARGLSCLHRHGLVHGDVKQHNIMWSADTAAFALIDFGLSSRVEEQYRHRVHSPEYSAPEVLLWNQYVEKQQQQQQQQQHQAPLTPPNQEEKSTHKQKESSAKQQLLGTRQERTALLNESEKRSHSEALQSRPQQQQCCISSSELNLQVQRPGQAADVWALGYTVAKLAGGRRLFPAIAPSDQREVDATVAALMSSLQQPPLFLQQLQTFISSCLRVDPAERATAVQLCALWGACDPVLHPPTYHDLVTLPSPVLRIMNIQDAGHSLQVGDEEALAGLISKCQRFGDIIEHRLSSASGHLYMRFTTALDAETAFQHFQGKVWRGRTLVPTFYPPEFYNEDI